MLPSGKLLRRIAALLGTTLRDAQSGDILGKAFVVVWRGRIHVLGYNGLSPLRPVVIPRERPDYWRLSLAFTAAREPDYPRLDPPRRHSDPTP